MSDGGPDPMELVEAPAYADPTPEPRVGHTTAGHAAPAHDRDHAVPAIPARIPDLIAMGEDLIRRCGTRQRAYQDAMWQHLAPELIAAHGVVSDCPGHPLAARWRARIERMIPSLAR